MLPDVLTWLDTVLPDVLTLLDTVLPDALTWLDTVQYFQSIAILLSEKN